MKRLWLIVGIIMLAGTLSGCETVEGIGEDFSNTGDNLKDLAEKIDPPKAEEDF